MNGTDDKLTASSPRFVLRVGDTTFERAGRQGKQNRGGALKVRFPDISGHRDAIGKPVSLDPNPGILIRDETHRKAGALPVQQMQFPTRANMPGDAGMGRERSSGTARSSPVTRSGKFSSILAYLDHVSADDVPRHHGGQRGDDHGGFRCTFDGLDSRKSSTAAASSTSSSAHQRRRRPRQEYRSQQGQTSSPPSSDLARGRGVPARWDNSMRIENNRTILSTKCQDIDAFSVPHDGGSSGKGVDFVRRSQSHHTAERTSNRDGLNSSAAAARDGLRNRPHRDTVRGVYSAAVHGDHSPSADDAGRMVGGGGGEKFGTDEERRDTINSAGGTKVMTNTPPAAVNGTVRQRRWVWDEWEDNENRSSFSFSRQNTSGHGESDGGKRSSIGPAAPALSPSSSKGLHPDNGWMWRSPSRRDKGDVVVDNSGDDCPPAAKQAYEGVQATARAMKASLKERRSEVREHAASTHATTKFLAGG